MSNPAVSAPRRKKPKRYLTKRDLCERYVWKTPLSVDRAWKIYGTLPPPTLFHGRRPLWAEDVLDAFEATMAQPPEQPGQDLRLDDPAA